MPEPPWLDEAMRKYKLKEHHVKQYITYTNLIPTISDKAMRAQVLSDTLKNKVKDILDANGVFSDYHPAYLAYSRALDKSQRTFEFMVDRIREHTILREKWETRGLDPSILDKLDDVLIFNKIP